MTVNIDVAQAIVAALRQHEAVKLASSDNPLSSRSLEDLIGGVRKGADNYPAQINVTEVGLSMEEARVAGLKAGKAERESRRRKAARARRSVKAQIDALADSPVVPPRERLDIAWPIVIEMLPIIESIAKSKRRWVQRYLGDLTADVNSMALERMVSIIAKCDMNIDVLTESARALARNTPRVPLPDDATDDDRKHAKAVKRSMGWLMRVVNNCVMSSIDTAYRSDENVRWENLDVIATIVNAVNGPGEDSYIARHKADRTPGMSGFRWSSPGTVDPALLSVAINAAITDRGLDPLVELFIGQGNTHPSGLFRWEELAEQVFLLSPGDGPWMWDAVARNTADLSHPRKAQASKAKQHVRRLFAWLPSFVCDFVRIVPELPYVPRDARILVPALTFATLEEASMALAAVLDDLPEPHHYEPGPIETDVRLVYRTETLPV